MTQHERRRASAAVCYLHPAMKRPNSVITNAQTKKIILENRRAVGVEYIRNGKVEIVNCEREIWYFWLNYCRQTAFLSGIGPTDELKAHGIEMHHMDGVGKTSKITLTLMLFAILISQFRMTVSINSQKH